MYSLLELIAGLMETEFKLGFGEFVRAICQYLNIEVKSIIQIWTRTAIANDTEIADICQKSAGIVSQRSILANHPFVEDVQAEINDLEGEKQKSMENYAGAFGGAVNEPEPAAKE